VPIYRNFSISAWALILRRHLPPLVHHAKLIQGVQESQYRAAKRYGPADVSSTGAYRWCSHLANASEAVSATASLQFRPSLPLAVYDHADQ